MDDDVPRSDLALLGDERDQLAAFLFDQRREIVALLDGVTEEQARRRLVPSLTTLLGLVKHATFVERVWSDVAFSGRTRRELGLPEEVDDSFVLDDHDTVASVRDQYLRAVADSDAVTARLPLDGLARHNRRGPMTLRWVHLHLLRELARHAGHGDILREQITADGGTAT
jgi:hypothetical protein